MESEGVYRRGTETFWGVQLVPAVTAPKRVHLVRYDADAPSLSDDLTLCGKAISHRVSFPNTWATCPVCLRRLPDRNWRDPR